MYLTLDDIVLILRTLSQEGISNTPDEIQQSLQPEAVHLARLLTRDFGDFSNGRATRRLNALGGEKGLGVGWESN